MFITIGEPHRTWTRMECLRDYLEYDPNLSNYELTNLLESDGFDVSNENTLSNSMWKARRDLGIKRISVPNNWRG